MRRMKYQRLNHFSAGLQNITIWITHRMQPDTFSKILTLGTAGKKKSKKKGKPGKVSQLIYRKVHVI